MHAIDNIESKARTPKADSLGCRPPLPGGKDLVREPEEYASAKKHHPKAHIASYPVIESCHRSSACASRESKTNPSALKRKTFPASRTPMAAATSVPNPTKLGLLMAQTLT